MQKIVQVVSDTNIGGAGRYLLNYLKYYDRQQYAVTVILPAGSKLLDFAGDYGADIVEAPYMADRSYDRRCVQYMKDTLRTIAPDILHTHASLSARIAGRRAKVPCIISTRHCMEPVSGGVRGRVKAVLNNRYSDIFIGVADAVGENLVACGVSPDKVRVVYNGVEPLHKLNEQQRTKAREAYGYGPEDVVFGIVARVEPVKDHSCFVQAAAEVQNPHARFLVVGDGSLLPTVKEQAHSLGLADRMTFTGYVKDTTEVMNVLDVNIISSRSEAMSLSLLEAMSLGKPSVATDAGGTPEVIEDGQTGLLVPPGDSSALAAGMQQLADSPEQRHTLSANAQSAYEKTFTAKAMVANLEKLYREVNSNGRR